MPAILIKATSDVSKEEIGAFATRIGPQLSVTLGEGRPRFRSIDAPSWVHLLQSPEFWLTTLVGNVAWDAVKASIAHRRDVAGAIEGAAVDTLRDFAVSLALLRDGLGEATQLRIGCPIPNDWFSTVMPIEGSDPELTAHDLALFLVHLPALDRFLAEHAGDLAGQITLELLDDGTMSVAWMDIATLTPHKSHFRL